MKYRWMLLVASLQAADPWDDLRAKNPVGTTMELRLAGPTVSGAQLIQVPHAASPR
jgi:hypothetical protein